MTDATPLTPADPAPASAGKLDVSASAIATIAAHAASRSYGVVGMAPKNAISGITGVLNGGEHKGIDVHFNADSIRIDLHVVVEYGTRISSVARSLANAVRFQVEHAVGLPVTEVNVYVQGLRVSSPD